MTKGKYLEQKRLKKRIKRSKEVEEPSRAKRVTRLSLERVCKFSPFLDVCPVVCTFSFHSATRHHFCWWLIFSNFSLRTVAWCLLFLCTSKWTGRRIRWLNRRNGGLPAFSPRFTVVYCAAWTHHLYSKSLLSKHLKGLYQVLKRPQI